MSLIRTRGIYKKKKGIKSLPEGSAFVISPEHTGRLIKGAPQYNCRNGSFTLEAAIVFPFLACLFAFLLFYFHLMRVELAVQWALESAGRDLSVLASLEKEEEKGDTGYFLLTKGAVYLKLREDEIIEKYVVGGAKGIALVDSEFSGDYIFLKANYLVKFPIGLFGRYWFWIHQQAVLRKWTGYRPADSSEKEDIWVYVTETGRVYHKKKNCPYLDLSISEAELCSIGEMRNKSGHKYSLCLECGKKTAGSIVYITDYGTKYHFDPDCSGLKRTIYQVRLSETGGRNACTKCCR